MGKEVGEEEVGGRMEGEGGGEEGRGGEGGGRGGESEKGGGGCCFIMADYYAANQVTVWFHTTGPAALTVGVFFYRCVHTYTYSTWKVPRARPSLGFSQKRGTWNSKSPDYLQFLKTQETPAPLAR